ncbi:MAG: DUF6049 family protein [Acidimicrobiales bacterium]|nr:DUF6049 family protein [Acidimicrobiales bacterium]
MRLIAQSPFTNPIDVFTLRLRIDNAPDNAKLAFRLYEDVASRGRGIFQQTIVGRSLGGARRTITVAIDNLPRNDDGSYTASFPVGGTATPFTLQVRPGQVYPFAVSLQNVDGDELDRFITYLITLPIAANNEAPPLAVAVIVPISSRPGFQPDGRIEFSDSERDRIDSMLRALANTAQVPATIAPTPETIWALGELIGNTPQWRAMLIRTADRRQVLGGPYVNLEVGAFVDAGMNDELARQFRLGTDRLSTDFDTRPDRQTWIMDPSITPEALTRLKELGVDQVVIPEHLLTGIGPERTIAQPFEIEAGNGERIRAVMAEDRLAAHVFDTDMPALNAHHVLADLATLFHEQPSVARGAVVLANELGASAEFVETLLGALGQQPAPTTDADVGGKPIFTATTIDQLVERVGGSVVNGQPQVRGYLGQTPPSLGSFPTQLGYAYHSLAGYRSLLGPADAGRAESIERNLWVSSARQLDPQQRQNYLDAAVGLINHEAEQIRFPPQSSVTLTAEDAEIPVVVENGTGYPVTVKIRFTSDKLEFPGGAERIVRLEPGMNRLNVEVRARASGAFPVTVSMSSPDDAIAIGSTKFRLRSTAVSGIGLLLSIGAGLFLLIWWSRHFRSVRRRSQLVTPLDHQRHAAGANCETAGREGTTSK